MQIQITGHQIDIGDALRTHVRDELEAAVSKYFDRPGEAHVTFSRSGPAFHVDCRVHLSSGLLLNAKHEGHDIYPTFDGAKDRLEKQLRRYKRRLKNHGANHKSALPAENVASFVIAAPDDSEEVPEDHQPMIVAEGATEVPALSVGDAVMRMDMSDAPFYIFRNGANRGINLVYRREDGNIGWIDTSRDISE